MLCGGGGESTALDGVIDEDAAPMIFLPLGEDAPGEEIRWIDFIRIDISDVGGLNMARKVAACCEFFNVRTGWHGPGNVSPVGHAVNMHLDLACYNFGIQE